jgi:hypothetical protein
MAAVRGHRLTEIRASGTSPGKEQLGSGSVAAMTVWDELKPVIARLLDQQSTTLRDKLIADEISKRAQAALKPSGTQRAHGKEKRS